MWSLVGLRLIGLFREGGYSGMSPLVGVSLSGVFREGGYSGMSSPLGLRLSGLFRGSGMSSLVGLFKVPIGTTCRYKPCSNTHCLSPFRDDILSS